MRFSHRAMASPFVASLVLALLVGTTPTLVAQVTSGSLNGTVKDATGGVLANATVTVTNPATGVTRTVSTSESGDFVVPNLPPGTYTIRVEAQGFKALEKSGLQLSATDRLSAQGTGDVLGLLPRGAGEEAGT